MISRATIFIPGNEPLTDALLQSLRSKYGAETDIQALDVQRRRVMWAFDVYGKLTPRGGAITLSSCGADFPGGFSNTQFEHDGKRLYDRSRDPRLYDWLKQNAGCGSVVSVDITGGL